MQSIAWRLVAHFSAFPLEGAPHLPQLADVGGGWGVRGLWHGLSAGLISIGCVPALAWRRRVKWLRRELAAGAELGGWWPTSLNLQVEGAPYLPAFGRCGCSRCKGIHRSIGPPGPPRAPAPHTASAITSISTRTSLGRRATSTVERAGAFCGKKRA